MGRQRGGHHRRRQLLHAAARVLRRRGGDDRHRRLDAHHAGGADTAAPAGPPDGGPHGRRHRDHPLRHRPAAAGRARQRLHLEAGHRRAAALQRVAQPRRSARQRGSHAARQELHRAGHRRVHPRRADQRRLSGHALRADHRRRYRDEGADTAGFALAADAGGRGRHPHHQPGRLAEQPDGDLPEVVHLQHRVRPRDLHGGAEPRQPERRSDRRDPRPRLHPDRQRALPRRRPGAPGAGR